MEPRIPHTHDDIIKWKHFPRNWPFVRGIHRSPVNSPHKGQWHGALMFSLICVWINGWVNNREAGDLRRYLAHYDVTVMRDRNGFTTNFYLAIILITSASLGRKSKWWNSSEIHTCMRLHLRLYEYHQECSRLSHSLLTKYRIPIRYSITRENFITQTNEFIMEHKGNYNDWDGVLWSNYGE